MKSQKQGPAASGLPIRPTVFVVDDDEAVLSSLRFSLEIEGFRVRLFQNPQALLREHTFPENACLLLDYRLPEINGLELLRRLRARGVKSPAILMTGHADPSLRRAAKEAGAGLLEKPYLNDNVASAIRAAIG